MNASMKERVGRIDFTTLLIVFFLVGLGMLMIYSSSIEVARLRFNQPTFFLTKQVARILMAFVLFYIAMNTDYHWIAGKYRTLIALSVAVLIIVLVSSNVVQGSKRWVSLFGMSFQPSDFARLSLIICMAKLLSLHGDVMNESKEHLIMILVIAGAVCLLIFLQPNFSTAASVFAIVLVMLFAGGLKIGYFLGLFALSLPAGGVLLLAAPYRVARVKAFLDPTNHHVGYQAMQSLIALGSGGLSGVGLGNSSQKHLYLPEPYTDFVFSIVGEEFGFIGVCVVFVLFALLIWRGFSIARKAPDRLGFFLALGITSMLCIYFLVHVGVVSSLLPTTGIPLPFISYGGSNLIFTMISVGILLNISGQSKK